MDPKEENVEYHIEIQKCETGPDTGNGEVMYVLDLGGADIPENIAMQLAQLAADGSLNLSEGTNSIMLQNESADNQTHIMQIENEGQLEGDEASQIIHLQMEEDAKYLADTTSGVSVLPPVAEVNFQEDLIEVEKSIFGKSKSRQVGTISRLDRGGKIEKTPKSTSSKPKTSLLQQSTDQTAHASKSNKTPAVLDSRDKKNKGDKLTIFPFLNGKTPVMLTVRDDGQVVPEGVNNGEILMKTEMADPSVDAKNPPIILDFSAEKSKLDLLLPEAASSNNQQNEGKESLSSMDTPIGRTEEPPDHIEIPIDKAESQFQEKEAMENESSVSLGQEEGESSKSPGKAPADDSRDEVTPKVEPTAPAEPMEESSATETPHKICDYGCKFETSDPLELAQHLEIEHEDKTPYHCFECEKKFKLNVSLVIHKLIHQKDAKPTKKKRGPYGARHKFYQCPLCSVKRKLKQEMLLHAKKEHGLDKTDIFTCEACKFVCYSEEELKSHFESVSHTADRRSFCDICNQSFTNIYQHRAAVHSDARPFLCNQCGYSAKTKSSLRYHMVIHLETKDWSCPTCPYKSSSERRLKRHMKIHDPNKKHQCPKCNFATHDAYEYKRHFSKVHSKVKSYNCKFCDQKFDKHHEIRLHLMFEHECNDAFFCNFCEFTCATRADYKEHIQVHYGKNKHVCEICGFTGRYRTHYRRHMLTHTTNKPFTCKICFKNVREASNLRRHMLTHTEDKPLACSVCGYRCKIRSRLMNHMKTHSELRPFACHLCKYTTKFNGNLMKHLENHARYKPHKCQYCSYACNERNKLRRHMNFRHKGLTEMKKESDVEGGEGEKEIVLLPSQSQEQFVLVSKEELEKMVSSVDENGAVLSAANGNAAIIVDANAQVIAQGTSESEKHIIVSNENISGVSNRKDRTVLTTLEIEGKTLEALVTLEDDGGES